MLILAYLGVAAATFAAMHWRLGIVARSTLFGTLVWAFFWPGFWPLAIHNILTK